MRRGTLCFLLWPAVGGLGLGRFASAAGVACGLGAHGPASANSLACSGLRGWPPCRCKTGRSALRYVPFGSAAWAVLQGGTARFAGPDGRPCRMPAFSLAFGVMPTTVGFGVGRARRPRHAMVAPCVPPVGGGLTNEWKTPKKASVLLRVCDRKVIFASQ